VQFTVVSGAFSANWWTGLMFFTIQSNIWIIVTILSYLMVENVEFTKKVNHNCSSKIIEISIYSFN
jgi:hypothetical protein